MRSRSWPRPASTSRASLQHVDEFRDVELDDVVTVCDHAHESCPVLPGKTTVIHVGFDDPPRLAKEAATEEEALEPLPPRARRDPGVRGDTARGVGFGVRVTECRQEEIRRQMKEKCEYTDRKGIGFFERYLTVWVILCIVAGIVLGKIAPGVAKSLDGMAIYVDEAPVVSIPIALCLFFMMYPIMVKIDFAEVLRAGKAFKPVGLTLFINWAVKPFTMYAIAVFFLGTLFLGLIGPDAVDYVKMPLGATLAVGDAYGSGQVCHARRDKNAGGPALAELSGRLHPAGHRALHGHGPCVGLPRPRQRRPHARDGRRQLADDARSLRRARRVPAGSG